MTERSRVSVVKVKRRQNGPFRLRVYVVCFLSSLAPREFEGLHLGQSMKPYYLTPPHQMCIVLPVVTAHY